MPVIVIAIGSMYVVVAMIMMMSVVMSMIMIVIMVAVGAMLVEIFHHGLHGLVGELLEFGVGRVFLHSGDKVVFFNTVFEINSIIYSGINKVEGKLRMF